MNNIIKYDTSIYFLENSLSNKMGCKWGVEILVGIYSFNQRSNISGLTASEMFHSSLFFDLYFFISKNK